MVSSQCAKIGKGTAFLTRHPELINSLLYVLLSRDLDGCASVKYDSVSIYKVLL